MKKLILALWTMALFAADSAAWRWRRLFARGQSQCVANIFTEGIHEAAKTVKLDATVTVRNLLYKLGSDAAHVAVCAATADVPLGTIDDEGVAENDVALLILGKGPTKKMVASEAIVVGDILFTTTSGKVQNAPGAGAATYYQVGVALTAAAADGDVIEVADCAPIKLVMT